MRYREIKRILENEELDEVRMGPSDFQRFADSTEAEGMLMGIEFEMCVPNANAGDDEPEWEYDYDQNERAWSIDDIVNFFENGDFSNMGPTSAQRARESMWDEFLDWQSQAIANGVDEDELDDRIRDRLREDISWEDYVDDAREDLGDEAPDTEVEKRAQELADEKLQNLMTDRDSQEYEDAYDRAREEIEEEMRNDSDYDEEAWLSDIGVSDMQDAERYWGYDWPHMYDPNEGGGNADVDTIATDFEDGTGYTARGYTGYHSASRETQQQEGYWVIEPDASIDAERGDAGLEFISPALPLKDGLEAIERVKKWAKSAGCYTNKSTGLHMNISVPNLTTETLDYVKLALFLGDRHVLEQFGRSYNTYCKSAMDIVKQKIQENPENATALLNKMKEHINAAASKLIHTGVTQKYTSINTKGKYVEFRGPGGDYLDQDLDKLTNTALRLAMALNIAADDNAYKKEYAKKLYKLVSKEGDWTDPNHSVALFTRYATGEIKKAELLDNIRQAQVARREKKGANQQYWVMFKDPEQGGGKQMVFAQSETEAIIKGGKQIGLDRENSLHKLKAITYDSTKKMSDDEVYATLTDSWKDWVTNTLPNLRPSIAEEVKDSIASGNRRELTPDQQKYLIDKINAELASHSSETSTSTDEVFGTLPQAHQQFIRDIANTSDMSLINVLRNVRQGEHLTEQQAAYMRIKIKHELRRRGIDPSSETQPAPEPQQEPDADLDSQAHEPEPDAPPTFEVVRRDTREVVSTIRGGDMVYAHSQARDLEREMGLDAGTLAVRAMPAEPISELRKLAGLL